MSIKVGRVMLADYWFGWDVVVNLVSVGEEARVVEELNEKSEMKMYNSRVC